MEWQTVCEATNVEDFGACAPPFDDIPAGTKVRITAKTPWYLPIAPFFDLMGAEWIASYLAPAGLTDIDISGEGAYTIVITGEVSGVAQGVGYHTIAIMVVVLALLAGFAAIGLTVFVLLKLEVLMPHIAETAKWIAYAVLGGAGLFLVASIIRRRRT